VEDGHPVAEARAEAAERLGSERDLRDEDDRSASPRQGVLAATEVDLGLAAPGGAEEEERAAAVIVQGRGDALERGRLRPARLDRRLLPGELVCAFPAPCPVPPLARRRRNEAERARRRGAVVLGDPERKVDEWGWHCAEDAIDGDRLDFGRRLVLEPDDHSAPPRPAEAHGDDGALLEVARKVRERSR
jgi:hypothetical protein